jgi:hypothetical protein
MDKTVMDKSESMMMNVNIADRVHKNWCVAIDVGHVSLCLSTRCSSKAVQDFFVRHRPPSAVR